MPGSSLDLWEGLTRPSTLARDIWEWTGDEMRRGTYGDLLHSSRRSAAELRRLGVERGSVVAAIITNSHAAVAGFTGAWIAGARVASLPTLARGMAIPLYLAQLERLVADLEPAVVLADDRVLQILPEDFKEQLDTTLASYESLLTGSAVADIEPLEPDEIIFIQYSSGSTGKPKGVMLTRAAIESQIAGVGEALSIDPVRDRVVTWLPMSHDMGLFGGHLTAWALGTSVVRSAPERFVASPKTWLEDCVSIGATITPAPPFALNVAARAAGRVDGRLGVRCWLLGADQVNWGPLTEAVDRLAPLGVRLESVTTAYGLAEATLAVTTSPLDRAPAAIDVRGEALMAGSLERCAADDPGALRLVSAGRPIPGASVRTDPAAMGEIHLRSTSLGSGYFGDADATAAAFDDGEFKTGDIGIVGDDGELYVVGRHDDVLVVAGRNIRAGDVEVALARRPGVRPGNCALIDLRDGAGSIAIVAEIDGEVDTGTLARALRKDVLEIAGVRVRECVFLERGQLPKTPSGKLQRFRCRAIVSDSTVGVRV